MSRNKDLIRGSLSHFSCSSVRTCARKEYPCALYYSLKCRLIVHVWGLHVGLRCRFLSAIAGAEALRRTYAESLSNFPEASELTPIASGLVAGLHGFQTRVSIHKRTSQPPEEKQDFAQDLMNMPPSTFPKRDWHLSGHTIKIPLCPCFRAEFRMD